MQDEWLCVFCKKDCDESNHQLDTITSLKLLSNGLFTDGVGDKFSIVFRNKEGSDLSQFKQFICEDCLIENPDGNFSNLQPYFLEPKIFTFDFINAHHQDAVFKGFIDEDLVKYNGDQFHSIMTSLGLNITLQRKKYDDLLKANEKTKAEIEKNSEFVFTGKRLKNLTGLRKADFDEIIPYVEPFAKHFRSFNVKEAITACFAYMRFVKFNLKGLIYPLRTDMTYDQLLIMINKDRKLANRSNITRQMLSDYVKKGIFCCSKLILVFF